MAAIQGMPAGGYYATAATAGAAPVGTVGVAETATATADTEAFNAIDEDVFLKLLVAQMKYQDPSNPTDPTQFLTQTAQFTVVERLSQLSALNQKVLDASNAQSATSMLGRTVTYTDVSGISRTGVVTATTFGSQTPSLTVDGLNVSLDDITSVSA